ncbi:flavin reductase family protein [Kitasatospora cinereorecta]|uniref:Flavin reductase family protein n=1 Tax=Kitasatospora cinereorecta TaxID=285560 RepID=A0ABW0VLB5_9ACTN
MGLVEEAGAGHSLRSVLGRFATGVGVVTTRHRGQAVGLTVNSFTSVSLDPPLVLWCLRRSSTSRVAFTGADHFAINVLACDQRELAVRFARSGDRFAGLAVESGWHGLPLLPGAVGTLACRRDRLVGAGDHLILIGRVLHHRARFGAPLLFVDGEFSAGPDLTDGVKNSIHDS